MKKYDPKSNHIKLIELAGGQVEDGLFVSRPGVCITNCTTLTDRGSEIFNAMNIDDSEPIYRQNAEFNSRITYMSFPEKKQSSKEYNDMMVNKFGHLSVYNDFYATILFAGISVECALELVAHNEGKVARLTSSKTKAQNDPLFVLLGGQDIERSLIRDVLSVMKKYSGAIDYDVFNNLFPGSKAVSLTLNMSLKDWHKTFIGRISETGVEREVRLVMERAALLLGQKFGGLIKTPEEYLQMGNKTKYEN